MGRPCLLTAATTYFDRLEREDQFWVLGWFYADGNNATGEASITVHSQDEEVLGKIKAAMGGGSLRPCTKQRASRLRVSSRHLCHRLSELGCVPAKSLTVTYPTFITKTEDHRAFLRGVFEGDGSLYATGQRLCMQAEIASGSLDFLNSLQSIIKDLTGLDSVIGYTRGLPRKLKIGHGYRGTARFMAFLYDTPRLDLTMKRKLDTWLAFKAKLANPPAPRTDQINLSRQVTFVVKSPEGQIHKSNTGKAFAIEHSLSVGSLHSLVTGRKHYHSVRGWTIPSEAETVAATEACVLVAHVY